MLANADCTTTIAVTDIARARAFYGDKLGLKPLDSPTGRDDDALFGAGGGSKIYLYQRDTPGGSTATTCSFEVDDVRAEVEALKGKGVVFEEYDVPEMDLKTEDGVATIGDLHSAWCKDPDGNILSIADNPHAKHDRPVAATQAH